MADRDRQGGGNRSSRRDDSSLGEWQQWPEAALRENRERNRSPEEDEWEQWPAETMHAHQGSPQPGEEIWEQLPEDAMHKLQALPSEEAIYHSLDASLHPALRSNFKIQEYWDRAPEMVSPMMTGANPQAATFLPLSGELADEDPQDKKANGNRRRRPSKAPSPELNSRHHHRRRHHEENPDGMKPDSSLMEVPRHGHRRHRRHRSKSPGDKAEAGNVVVERHTEDEIPIRRKHHRSERRRSKTPEDRADSGDVIRDGHTGSGKHSRHVHFRSDGDAEANDQGDRRTKHRKSSHRPGRPRSRTTATHHNREYSPEGTFQGDHEATSTSYRRR